MKIYKVVVLLLGIVFFSLPLKAQDTHFTQFYAAPLTLNPALTGSFDGKYRVSAIYRDQWRGVLDNPYTTFATAIDLRFPIKFRSSAYKDAAGGGIVFFTDKVPSVDFSNTQLSVSGAYHKSLNVQNNQYISLGFQAGIGQRNVNYENLTFHDQFDGTTGFTDPTGESLPANNISFSDFSVGLNYTFSPNRKTHFFLGAAMHHILEPQVSFFYDKEDFNGNNDNRLFRKYSGQFSAQFPISDDIQLLPRVLFSTQGPHMEINAGTNFRFKLGDFGSTALHLGGWARPVTDESESFRVDAIVGMVGIEYSNVLFGFSYDASLNDLNNSKLGQGAFEISIAYLGNYDNDLILCPKF